ncbi:unnamed protein product [Ceutorhynchus assimilis]|uniref:BZIP domain-containing protein n=1 Tax=Ceutorhynchus assimilis TaxID=467358 RepID=A0A9N9QJ55_9CUCU|nr:unnamed protein product [Ceutorhynchus assimilis]
MNVSDIFMSGGEEGSNNMDISENYNPELMMSSEFFDSVLSLQNDLDDGFLSAFEDENNMYSDASHNEEVLSPQSYYSESDKNSNCSTENTDTDTSGITTIDGLDDPTILSFLDTITQQPQEVKDIPVIHPITPAVSPPRFRKIVIQNPNNKKCIAKPLINATQLRKGPANGKPQIIKVQQITSNGRSVFVPLNIKSIKLLNSATDVAALTNKRKIEPAISVLSDDDTETIPEPSHQYPSLHLNNEEKRLLAKEGIQLPTHYPLTKNQERELKRIRRKIRNKISAQDSRKRKKEYVDGLEERVKNDSDEKKNLLQRVKELQRQNRTLVAHVQRLQALISKSSTSKATPSTCLMVFLLSALLVSLPNTRLFESKDVSIGKEQVSIRRSLLSDLQATAEDDLNMEEFLIFKDDEPELDAKFGDYVQSDDNSTEKRSSIFNEIAKKHNDFMIDKNDSMVNKNDSDKMGILGKIMQAMGNLVSEKPGLLDPKLSVVGGAYNQQGFIDPDIDDYLPVDEGPSLKRARYATGEYELTLANMGVETVVSSTVTNQVQVTKDK